jgi:hypothetical protein
VAHLQWLVLRLLLLSRQQEERRPMPHRLLVLLRVTL